MPKTVDISVKSALFKIDDGLLIVGVGDQKYASKTRKVTRRFLNRLKLDPKTYMEGNGILSQAIADYKGDKRFQLEINEKDNVIKGLKTLPKEKLDKNAS